MQEAKSGHCLVPPTSYNGAGFYHPDAQRPGSINSTGSYFLQDDIHAFDNAFFGTKNVEATYMDAQQPKLLDVVYESLESAGILRERSRALTPESMLATLPMIP